MIQGPPARLPIRVWLGNYSLVSLGWIEVDWGWSVDRSGQARPFPSSPNPSGPACRQESAKPNTWPLVPGRPCPAPCALLARAFGLTTSSFSSHAYIYSTRSHPRHAMPVDRHTSPLSSDEGAVFVPKHPHMNRAHASSRPVNVAMRT